ncbi:aminotransferase class IV [Planctomycetota bacterium]
MQIAQLQDKIIPFDEIEQVYLDRGLYFGDGVYEVLRSYNGKLFAFEEHMERFAHSLAAVEITNVEMEKIRSSVLKAFETAEIANAKIYFHITRGSAPRDHICPADLAPNFFLTVTQLADDTQLKAKGMAVSTYPDLRWKRCDIKSLNLLPNVLARQEAARKGSHEAILVNDEGFITEGAASAFFAVKEKKLQTSPLAENILPSITRKFVLKAGDNLGMEIIEKSLTPQQASCCDELFIAVTTKDIVPVIRFDDKIIKDGKPGEYTKALTDEFRKFTT